MKSCDILYLNTNTRNFANIENRNRRLYSSSDIPESQLAKSSPIAAEDSFTTSTSPPSVSPRLTPQTSKVQASKNLTQNDVEADPQLKRRQQDLLVLTSLNDNSTLHWRPSWFKQDPFNKSFWTLHNPPNVVTERLPNTVPQSKDYYTRSIRQDGDRPPLYIKTWDGWNHYSGLYGVPLDFLSEDQVDLMRMGLPRTVQGALCAPPAYPLYPEPQPLGGGSYLLNPSTHATHLPPKFRSVKHDAAFPGDVEVVVVHSDGALRIERKDEMFKHHIRWMHSDGKGENRDTAVHAADGDLPKQQGPARRWSYVPWSSEQDESCKRPSLVTKLKVNYKRKYGTMGRDGTTAVALGTEQNRPRKKKNGDRIPRELQ